MKFRTLICSVVLCVMAVSCKEYKVAKMMRDFQKTPVVIPNGLYRVHDRNQTTYEHPGGKPLMVFYYDSLSCSSCQINHLSDLRDLYELSDSSGSFEVMTIFAPRMEEFDGVFEELMIRDFEYPLYLDLDGIFSKSNPNIPADTRFHSFLLDPEGKPIFVGNPCLSDELWNIFLKTLNLITTDCTMQSR